jgi:hypothetical protein
MRDTSRIECYLSEYNVIQYSKFGWLEQAALMHPDCDYLFWMDAGCSRFFGEFDMNSNWPNATKLDTSKITIQGNINFINLFHKINLDDYIWDNNCVVVGTLFGGGREVIKTLKKEIDSIFSYLLSQRCVNNEQFALAFFAKKFPNLMDIKIILNGKHLPLFESLS